MSEFSNQKHQPRKGNVNSQDPSICQVHTGAKRTSSTPRVMNHLKQHLRVWHYKHFAIWGFSKDKWAISQKSVPYLGTTSSLRKNLYGYARIFLLTNEIDHVSLLARWTTGGNKQLQAKQHSQFLETIRSVRALTHSAENALLTPLASNSYP